MSFFSNVWINGASRPMTVLPTDSGGSPAGPPFPPLSMTWYSDSDGTGGFKAPDFTGQVSFEVDRPETYTTSKLVEPAIPWAASQNITDQYQAYDNGGQLYVPRKKVPFTDDATFEAENWLAVENAGWVTDRLWFSHYLVKYGLQSGNLNESFSTKVLRDPSSPRITLENLRVGAGYFIEVYAVDHAGAESVATSEIQLVAGAAPTTTLPTPDVIITDGDLPYTISSSGNYRYDGSLGWDGGNNTGAIIVNADNVVLFKTDGLQNTFAATNASSFIKIAGNNRSNVEIFGFDLLHAGYKAQAIESFAGIYMDNLGNFVSGLKIHSNTIVVGTPYQGMPSTQVVGGIVGRASGWAGEIYGNTIITLGTARGSLRAISGDNLGVGAGEQMRVHSNVINSSFVDGTIPNADLSYVRPIVGATEIDGNVINLNDMDWPQVGCTPFVPAGSGPAVFIHGNTINANNVNATRVVVSEENRDGIVSLYNDVIGDNLGSFRMHRFRFGSKNLTVGYNRYIATNSNLDASNNTLVDNYGDAASFDVPLNVFAYGNLADGPSRGIMNVTEETDGAYMWENESTTNCARGYYLRTIGGSPVDPMYRTCVHNMWSVNDIIKGSISDIYFSDLVGEPAVVNANFINPNSGGAVNIASLIPGETVQNVDYFLGGDSGLTNLSPDNIDASRIPSPPTNLRAA